MAPIDRCTSWRQIIMIEFVDQNTSLAPMPSTTLEIVQLRTQNTMTLRRKNLVMVDVFDFVRTHCTRKESRGNTCVIVIVLFVSRYIRIVRGRIPMDTNSYVSFSLPDDIPTWRPNHSSRDTRHWLRTDNILFSKTPVRRNRPLSRILTISA